MIAAAHNNLLRRQRSLLEGLTDMRDEACYRSTPLFAAYQREGRDS